MSDDNVARAIIEIRTDLSSAISDIQKLRDEFKNLGDHTETMKDLFTLDFIKEWGATALETVKKVGEAIVDFAERGTQVEEVKSAFDGLSASIGSTGSAMLGALREGTRGTVSDFELMKMANAALGDGVIKSAGDMQILARGGLQLGDAMGEGASKGLETLLHAIESGRAKHLAQYGLILDTTHALAAYADAHGISVEHIDAQTAASLRASDIMSQLKARFGDSQQESVKFGEAIDQVRVGLSNFYDNLSRATVSSNAMKAGLEGVRQALTSTFGLDQQKLIGGIVYLIETFSIGLVALAGSTVLGADQMSRAWYAVAEGPVLSLADGILKMERAIVDWVGVIAGLISKVPGFRDEAVQFQSAIAEFAPKINQAAQSVAEMSQQAALGAKGQLDYQKALQMAGFSLMDIADRMVDAQNASTGLTEEVKKIGPSAKAATGQLESEARRSAAEIKKLQEEVAAVGKMGLDKQLASLEIARDKEIAAIMQIKGATKQQRDEMVALIQEKYVREVAFAKAGTDQILQAERALVQQIAQANKTGLDKKLGDINFAEQEEIAKLGQMKIQYGAKYSEMVALVQQKYAQMRDAAAGNYANVEQAAEAEGFKTRAELEHTAAVAISTYERMLASGKYTAEELRQAHEKAEQAKRKATSDTLRHDIEASTEWAGAAGEILTTLGGKHKSMAIAGAILSTYAHVAKTLATIPWPASIPAAAVALATGMANVQKIRSSQPGFKEGTPNLDYVDFGAESSQMLHGPEAVVPQGKGHQLAQEIASSMPSSAGNVDVVHRLDRIADYLKSVSEPQEVPVSINVDGRKLGEAIFQLSKIGAVRIRSTAVVATT